MSAITLFSPPKPFIGHIGLIQRNAIASWARLRPAVDSVLIGDEDGVADAARLFGIRHLGDVERTARGTPLVSAVFARAEEESRSPLMAYANADIMLSGTLVDSVAALAPVSFPWIAVGRRWDLEITGPQEFGDGWEDRLRAFARTHGRLHGSTGIDYIVYPRGLYRDVMPPFAIGRVAWDNWSLFFARLMGLAVVDATATIDCWHQNHDYAHIPMRDGESDPHATDEQNVGRMLTFADHMVFTLDDATHVLLPDGRLVEAGTLGRQPRTPAVARLDDGVLWLELPGEVGADVRDGAYEPGIRLFLRRHLRPGMTVLDVGAHHGFHALSMARLVAPKGRVIAFEPSPRELLALRMNRAINGAGVLEIRPQAVDASAGTAVFHINRTLENGRNALGAPPGARRLRRWTVSATTLDEWWQADGHGPVDLVKIDAQGDELRVLDGATALVQRQNPVFVFDALAPREAIAVRLRGAGFRMAELKPDGSTGPLQPGSATPFLAAREASGIPA